MHILIIEDDAQIRNNLVEILQLEDYKTTAVGNGQDGVQATRDELPDVIFCDMMMPHMDGFEVLTKIRSNPASQHIPFIFVTARTEREIIDKGMNMGANEFLFKPFTTRTILELIESFNSE